MTIKHDVPTVPDHFAWIAGNPLLQFMPPELDFVGCADYMRLQPASEWCGPVPKSQRLRAINEVKRAFVPTKQALQAAMGMQNLIYTGLQHRDPRSLINRKRPYESGSLLGSEMGKLPWFPSYAAGMNIRGITGCGKTASIERSLSRFQQVIRHEKRDDCGWTHLLQLVYLVVPMPADGSRGGLLLQIALQMDDVLGTDYATHLRSRYKTVEKGLVAVLHWLSLHRCGILVIEEAQERHTQTEAIGNEFATFFLRILNFGVPLALVGNPLAFRHLDTFSQDVRRFSEGGRFDFDPVPDWRAAAWCEDLVPTVWGFNVFEQPDEFIEGLELMLWTYTGGIPDALARLRRETLFAAISNGSQHVTHKHIKKAYASPAYAPLHPIARAFSAKSVNLLRAFNDIPADYFEEKWKAEALAAHARVEVEGERSKLGVQKREAEAAPAPVPPELSDHRVQDLDGLAPSETRHESARDDMGGDVTPPSLGSLKRTLDHQDRRGASFLKHLTDRGVSGA